MTDERHRSKGNLLLYAPVPLYQSEDGFLLEDQACNGLRLWAENFDTVTVLIPLGSDTPADSWKPVAIIGPNLERIRFVPLPMSYRPDVFARNYRSCRDIIREEIDKADYLSFSIGGLFGDWGSVACYQAQRKQRQFAVWTDRVESEVVRLTASSGPLKQRIKARLTHRPMAWLERFLIRRATIGLFHGKETFDTYAPFCHQPILVHDIHISKSEHITADRLADKIKAVAEGPLKIGYVGRADPMKGPQDWVSTLAKLAQSGVAFVAFWMGEGTEMDAMRAQAQAEGIADQVTFLGFVEDREDVLEKIRAADVFMFCHKTPESPRCLIEALVSGTPIVGYDGAFTRDLISGHNGGRLVPLDDIDALVVQLKELADDRVTLAQIMGSTVKDGEPYDDVSVFAHRSNMIKQYL
jgi:colanic acid/amylovoran biosynthesis glycosyltransferase